MENIIHTQKDHILLQSSQIMMQDGVRSFTIDAFAKQLRISKKTIYKYFPTKEDLLIKSVEYFLNRIGKKIKVVERSEENSVIRIVKIMQIVLHHVSHISASRMAEMKMQYPNAWQKIEAFRLDRQQNVMTMLTDGQRSGYVRTDIDAEKTASLLINLVNSTFQPEFFIQNNFAPEEAMRLFLNIITTGIFTDKGKTIIMKEFK